MNEIGSEFWLESIPNERESGVPGWIRKFGDAILTASGRGAISLLLQEVQPKSKSALLPAYTCDSVILPFTALGYTCYFYDINTDLTPDLQSIIALEDVGIFLHMGYYGFPTNSGLTDIVARLNTEATIIVENITHTLFSDYRRFDVNDYYVASMRKWMALPSGGLLASPNTAIRTTPGHNEVFADTRKVALLAKASHMNSADEALKRKYLDLFAKGEAILAADVRPYHIDAASKTIISTLDVNVLKDRRRTNFRMLMDGLSNVEHIHSVFTRLPQDVCPLFYPIYITKKRSEIRQRLIEQDIYCPMHWPMPEQVEPIRFKNAAKIYDTELSIPCDQRYDLEDMERVISVLRGL